MFPIYIISKGRPGNVLKTGTTGKLSQFKIPHYIMVEESEKEVYEKYKTPYATILTLEDTYMNNRDLINPLQDGPNADNLKDLLKKATKENIRSILDDNRYCNWSKKENREEDLGAPMGFGAVASRNATKIHARSLGVEAFYNMDDNATGFFKWATKQELDYYDCWHGPQQDDNVPFEQRSVLPNIEKWGIAKISMSRMREDECDKVKEIFFDNFEPNLFKMKNLGFIGYNTVDACPRCVSQYLIRPMGRRVYSCTLMKTDYPHDWWGQTSDDVLLNIDCLSHDFWMACLWRWVMGKPMTQTTKGGCTTDAYGRKDGELLQTTEVGAADSKDETYALSTYPKTKFITSMYPQYLHTKAWKRRIHHEFLWDLMPNPTGKVYFDDKSEVNANRKIIEEAKTFEEVEHLLTYKGGNLPTFKSVPTRTETQIKSDVLEGKSNIDFLFNDISIEYRKAVRTKELLTKAPPKKKKNYSAIGNSDFVNKLIGDSDHIFEDGEIYETYDENFQ